MAKQLYDYWFVQFDFPDENGKPYKSSGGKMVWNEELNKAVPNTWSVGRLNKWLDIKSGYAFKSSTYVTKGKYKVITIKNVQEHQLNTSTCDFVNEIPQGMKDWCKLSINDRLISLTGNCGRLCLVTEDNLLLNQRVGILSCGKDYLNFAYLLLSSKEYQIICDNLANGAAQANLSPVKLCETHSIFPPDTIVKAFNIHLSPIVLSFIQNEQQIRTLTKQRDELLPLLMNGQVSVNYHLSYWIICCLKFILYLWHRLNNIQLKLVHKMKGEAEKIVRFFDGAKNRFKIPLYQRNYDWTKENCEQLFFDLKKLKDNSRKSHFFGSIVTKSEDDTHIIIDGQQRITTISLFFIALLKAQKDKKISLIKDNKTEYIRNTYLRDQYNDGEYKLQPIEKDAIIYKQLMEGDVPRNSFMKTNYDYFYQQICASDYSVDDWVNCVEKLEIIDIRLEKDDDPQLIFESLNSTSIPQPY